MPRSGEYVDAEGSTDDLILALHSGEVKHLCLRLFLLVVALSV